MEICEAIGTEQVELVRELFREYRDWLSRNHGVDLSYQGFDKEVASLPGEYARPRGRLLIAVAGGVPLGCAALRPFDATSCEIKRMYMRPESRGMGGGRMLAQRLIDESREMKYHLIRLDTLDFMKSAQRVYASLGFQATGPYYSVPESMRTRTRFLELPLK